MIEPLQPLPPKLPAVEPGADGLAAAAPVDDDSTVVVSAGAAAVLRDLAAKTAARKASESAGLDSTRPPFDDSQTNTALPLTPKRAQQLLAAATTTTGGRVRPEGEEPTLPLAHKSAAAADEGPGTAAASELIDMADCEATRLSPVAVMPLSAAPGLADTGQSQGRPRSITTLPNSPGFSASPRSNEAGADPHIRQVGRYQVQTRLGRGGMATVYRAHDPSIGRDVAIKFLHASLCEDDEYRMRFLREARAAGGLSHPNIVVVHDVGEIDNRPYMAMELITGSTLSDTLQKSRVLPIRDVVVIGLQLARALEYAHARGIVHRDIKPGNIMLLADGQTIKVADFGIAHMDDGTGEQNTVVGAVMGTPQYMSPEQTRGDKVDGRSDLFSAGIVMYQMLAGERPFRGESLVAVATKIANDEPAPLNQKRPDIPATLRRVVDRCLAKQPSQRYQSGQELADALLKVLGDIDETARERAKPHIVPLRVKWALMMGLIVAVVMGLTATIITQRQYAAMMGQVSEYGASLARFIAAQNAVSVLGDEWDAVDVVVHEIMKTGNFERVSVVDMSGVVRVSSQPALLNKPYKPEGVTIAGEGSGGATGTRYTSQGEDVLGFNAPVLFQGKRVGLVALGIPEKPLTQVARLSIVLMLVLAVVTVLAVAIAMYFVANWFAKPIRLVGDSMAEIGKGRFDHRIGEHRNDEFGLLFQSFDAMALALQQREPGTPASPPTLAPPSSSSRPEQPADGGQH